jgi:hypothetical protein
MESVRMRPLQEADIDEVIFAAGGRRAHENVDQRRKPGADYVLGSTVIELKILEEEGLNKPERQTKLAALFRKSHPERPVIVLDHRELPEESLREFDNILSGPVKTAVSSAKDQLKQSRTELEEVKSSVLMLINDGYTALDHETLLRLAESRVRRDTTSVDGIIVGGMYFHSDAFESYVFFRMDFIAIKDDMAFPEFETLREQWGGFSTKYMTEMMRQAPDEHQSKGPVDDLQFDIDGVTYIKPAPAFGAQSKFYGRERPRKNSTGIETAPQMAVTYPSLTQQEWERFKQALPNDPLVRASYPEYMDHLHFIGQSLEGDRVATFIPITFAEWNEWARANQQALDFESVKQFANMIFNSRVDNLLQSARELLEGAMVPRNYLLVLTEEIGQDRRNDVSHILIIKNEGTPEVEDIPFLENARFFHEYAVALGCVIAAAGGIRAVFWQKSRTYAWI